jgi:hypothetical protein
MRLGRGLEETEAAMPDCTRVLVSENPFWQPRTAARRGEGQLRSSVLTGSSRQESSPSAPPSTSIPSESSSPPSPRSPSPNFPSPRPPLPPAPARRTHPIRPVLRSAWCTPSSYYIPSLSSSLYPSLTSIELRNRAHWVEVQVRRAAPRRPTRSKVDESERESASEWEGVEGGLGR